MQNVVIYSRNWCGYCTRAKELLARKAVPFTEIEISDNDALQTEMIERAGGRRTVPQIFIGQTHVGGCDDLFRLEREGRLDALVADGHMRSE